MKQRNCLSLLRRRKNQSLIPCRYPFKSTALRAGIWGRLLSVGTSPYGRGTYGYAHSPLRGVCPPGTNKEEPRTADGRRLVYGMGGCDPYGGVRNHGVDVSPRSTTPGYVMGMLRIPQECISWRMRWKTIFNSEKTKTPPHTSGLLHLGWCAEVN